MPGETLNRLERRKQMKPYSKIAQLSYLIALAVASAANQCVAQDNFPEKGNRADWSDALPYYNQGNRYLSQQRYQEAVTSLEDAVGIYPFDPDFYVNLGVAYRKLDDYTNAERAFKKASTLNPKDWMTWSNLANAYLKQNKYKETKEAFQKTLTCNPPPEEQTAIKKDLLDLDKIISMQQLQAQREAKTASNKVAVKKSVVGTNTTPQKKISAAGQRPNTASDTTPTVAPVTREQLKQSGWDYSY